MKSLVFILSALFFLGFKSPVLFAQGFGPTIKVQPPENVFVPMGFDDNDNVQITLYGNLPDTCHKAGPVRVHIDKQRKLILLRNEVYFYSGCWCADVLVPYTKTLSLGVLKSGNYEIGIETGDGAFRRMGSLPISIATSASPDEYLYAPVDHMHLARAEGEPMVAISGTYRNSCMRMRDIKVFYRPGHVIEILPIVTLDTNGCLPVAQPFEYSVKLKPQLSGRALIHVRSLNGQSLNQVVEF